MSRSEWQMCFVAVVAGVALCGCDSPAGGSMGGGDTGREDAGGESSNSVDDDGDAGGESSNSVDDDGDGYLAPDDCDDADDLVHPGAQELCDEIANDCDGEVDEGTSAPTWYRDSDEDGFGALAETVVACEAPEGYVADGTDCDDERSESNPDADEICDGHDAPVGLFFWCPEPQIVCLSSVLRSIARGPSWPLFSSAV